jgi:hypothetical protein
MAIAALSNFTVPLASDQSAGSQGMLMPKLKYRFRVTFENFGKSGSATELTKQVQDCGRPSVKFANQVIEIYNSKINYAGKPTWDPIAVKIRDDVTGAVTSLIGEQNQRQFDFFEQSSAASAGDYKFTLRIEMLDGGNGTSTPNVLETWVCYGCYLVSTNYQGLDYKAQEAVVLDLSIQFDNAVQTTGGTLGASTPVMTPGASTSQNVMGS